MFFKLVFLTTVCCTLVISKSISRRDLPAVRVYDQVSIESRKDFKREDTAIKDLNTRDIALPPIALAASEEMVGKDLPIRLNSQGSIKAKRLAEEKDPKSNCCG